MVERRRKATRERGVVEGRREAENRAESPRAVRARTRDMAVDEDDGGALFVTKATDVTPPANHIVTISQISRPGRPDSSQLHLRHVFS